MVLDNKKAAFRPYSAHCSFPIEPFNALEVRMLWTQEIPMQSLKNVNFWKIKKWRILSQKILLT